MKFIVFALSTLSLAMAACSPYKPELGNTPYRCPDDQCPEGYTCETTELEAPNDKLCVSGEGLQIDANKTGFECLNIGFAETANDTKEGAFATPIAATDEEFSARTSICPELDKDHYSFDVVTNGTSVEATVSWENGEPVNVSILNITGTTIENGSPMGDLANRACAATLPIQKYYVSVLAAPAVMNNYRIEIKVVPNC